MHEENKVEKNVVEENAIELSKLPSSPYWVLVWAGLFALAFVATLAALPQPLAEESTDSAATASTEDTGFAIVGARVFDGEKTWPKADVWVENGRIRAIGATLELPSTLEKVDGSGATLMPGFLDAHVHTWGEARWDAVRFGVTTLLDQFTAPTELATARKDREAGGATDKSDLFSAGYLATVDGGHGTQYGLEVPTLQGPDSAVAWVKARKADGSDWVKIVLEPGWRSRSLPTLDLETVGALIEAAHAEDLKAVVHVSRLADALAVAELGADGLVHVWSDRVPTDTEVKKIVESGLFVVPTLVVLEGMSDASPSLALAEVEGFGGALTKAQRQGLAQSFPGSGLDFAVPLESIRMLAQAGVALVAGSDAPNPATAMGFSIHRELELLVGAGLEPEQALIAATSAPARAFGVPDRGVIQAGALADLVLADGDPTSDITHTRRLKKIWKAGHAIERKAPKDAESGGAEGSQAAEEPELVPQEPVLADFESGIDSRYGSGWATTTDQMNGGASEAAQEVVDGALKVFGEVKSGFAFPWSGTMVFLGSPRMAAVDLSAKKELRFRVRGDGRAYMVLFFSGSGQSLPARQAFEAGAEWTEIRIPLADFQGGDLELAKAFAFTASWPEGEYDFQIDDVGLH